jgi:hypothetical protein
MPKLPAQALATALPTPPTAAAFQSFKSVAASATAVFSWADKEELVKAYQFAAGQLRAALTTMCSQAATAADKAHAAKTLVDWIVGIAAGLWLLVCLIKKLGKVRRKCEGQVRVNTVQNRSRGVLGCDADWTGIGCYL